MQQKKTSATKWIRIVSYAFTVVGSEHRYVEMHLVVICVCDKFNKNKNNENSNNKKRVRGSSRRDEMRYDAMCRGLSKKEVKVGPNTNTNSNANANAHVF